MLASEHNKQRFVSERFQDVYFSVDGGREESLYVFCQGNSLAERWKDTKTTSFAIAELGFGTALGFLTCFHFWRDLHQKPSVSYFSGEAYPLPFFQLKEVQDVFFPDFVWPNGFSELYESQRNLFLSQGQATTLSFPFSEHFELKLTFGEIRELFQNLKVENTKAHAWFLDGFNPKTNPEMWREEIFQKMAEESFLGTTFATYSAAGFVRRGLEAVGFQVQKAKGFGKKREMLQGIFQGLETK